MIVSSTSVLLMVNISFSSSISFDLRKVAGQNDEENPLAQSIALYLLFVSFPFHSPSPTLFLVTKLSPSCKPHFLQVVCLLWLLGKLNSLGHESLLSDNTFGFVINLSYTHVLILSLSYTPYHTFSPGDGKLLESALNFFVTSTRSRLIS